MRPSIRTRFTLTFAGLTAVILFSIWGVNTWLLESFYTQDKVKILVDAYEQIDNVLLNGKVPTGPYSEGDDADELSNICQEFGEKYNTTIIIMDSTTGNVLISSARDREFLTDRLLKAWDGTAVKEKYQILEKEDNYLVRRSVNPRLETAYLECLGYFSDESTMVMISTPVASIWESVAISNRFLAYVGAAALLISCVIIYFVTRQITSPIQQLSKLSVQMSHLDFDAKYTGKGKDEIGILGQNMNVLSDRLKETIGELKSANNQLQKDINEKIQIDEMRKEFISNVSHELKTPIALIQGYAEGLSEGMCEDPESRDYYCGVIVDEANKMNKMVRQLLDLAALEFGDNTPVMECFDIVELIRGVLSSADILIQQHEAQVEFEAQGPVPVWADEFKIEEVVTNYLNNALNHVEGEKKIRIWLERQDENVYVHVYNTGQHIPEEDIPNLWTKFYKVDKARTREYGGSGIGLSIVKAIMDSHNKTCGITNTEGGVDFWFSLDGKA